MSGRGQLSLPVVEAAVGVVLVVGVTAAFAVAVPGPNRERAQLERYAGDTATTLAETPADEGEGPFLARALASPSAFQRARPRLRNRSTAAVPGSVRVRVETPRGAVGPPRPPSRPAGRATATTVRGPVRVVVWYG